MPITSDIMQETYGIWVGPGNPLRLMNEVFSLFRHLLGRDPANAHHTTIMGRLTRRSKVEIFCDGSRPGKVASWDEACLHGVKLMIVDIPSVIPSCRCVSEHGNALR
jgi:hypothetical protein